MDEELAVAHRRLLFGRRGVHLRLHRLTFLLERLDLGLQRLQADRQSLHRTLRDRAILDQATLAVVFIEKFVAIGGDLRDAGGKRREIGFELRSPRLRDRHRTGRGDQFRPFDRGGLERGLRRVEGSTPLDQHRFRPVESDLGIVGDELRDRIPDLDAVAFESHDLRDDPLGQCGDVGRVRSRLDPAGGLDDVAVRDASGRRGDFDLPDGDWSHVHRHARAKALPRRCRKEGDRPGEDHEGHADADPESSWRRGDLVRCAMAERLE